LKLYTSTFVKRCYRQEVAALSKILQLPAYQLMATNLYYDLLKFLLSGSSLLGCTAFAVDTDAGPIHARNLDWESENEMLRDYSVVFDFQRGGNTVFKAVSWPGFAAALSGIAPGRFAVTLNAVLSEEKAKLAKPVSFLIREVLEEAGGFDEAVRMLSATPIAADCLLLVTGTQRGEMCVIERTPRRAEIRRTESNHIIVTNDYRALKNIGFGVGSDLALTSCDRFDCASEMIRQSRPRHFDDCFKILSFSQVQMDITMQHMVMSPAQGRLEVRLPEM
jgi:predicted choloylglycine hydrolase